MQDPDHQIIRTIIAGDTRAYRVLVDRHRAAGMTLAMRMLRNREDAEEALQDAFVKAFRALPRFGFHARFGTWFYRIVYNTCADALDRRRTAARQAVLEAADFDEVGLDPASPDPSPEAIVAHEDLRALLLEELGHLPPAYAAILTMLIVEELSYQEIAEVTALPIGTVKTHVFRGRALLRRALARRDAAFAQR